MKRNALTPTLIAKEKKDSFEKGSSHVASNDRNQSNKKQGVLFLLGRSGMDHHLSNRSTLRVETRKTKLKKELHVLLHTINCHAVREGVELGGRFWGFGYDFERGNNERLDTGIKGRGGKKNKNRGTVTRQRAQNNDDRLLRRHNLPTQPFPKDTGLQKKRKGKGRGDAKSAEPMVYRDPETGEGTQGEWPTPEDLGH